MDASYMNPVLNAVVKVMKMMAHQDVNRGEVILKKNNMAFGEVSSLLELKGPAGQGSIAVSFPIDVIMNIAKVMLPPDAPRDNAMIKDLVGEMGNMFAGLAKSEMEEHGYLFNISTPAIFAGKPHFLKHAVKQPAVFIPFSSDIGTFFVEICFSKLKANNIVRSPLSYRGPSSLIG